MEEFSVYKFRIVEQRIIKKRWFYEIINDDSTILRKSKESFAQEGIARFAAIGHISLLEQGEG